MVKIMKLTYYLRGVGVGIVIATLILCISNNIGKKSENDEIKSSGKSEISSILQSTQTGTTQKQTETSTKDTTTASKPAESVSETVTQSQSEKETQTQQETTTQEVSTQVPGELTTQEMPTKPSSAVTETDNNVTIEIVKGMSSLDVAQLLKNNGIVEDAMAFNRYLESNGYDKKIQYGNISLSRGKSFEDIVKIICK